MKKEIVTCDFCERDLTFSGACLIPTLCLFEETRPAGTQVIVGNNWVPMINGTKHFCGLKCLELWVLNKNKEENQS